MRSLCREGGREGGKEGGREGGRVSPLPKKLINVTSIQSAAKPMPAMSRKKNWKGPRPMSS